MVVTADLAGPEMPPEEKAHATNHLYESVFTGMDVMSDRRVTLDSGVARVVVDLDHGARLASLVVEGRELLVTEGPSAFAWGCYPMAPWAGRVLRGLFSFEGVEYQLPINMGDHAIHGTVFDRPWEQDGNGGFVVDLGPDWPFSGHVRQVIVPKDDSLELRLEVYSDGEAMPAACGWHPWFLRDLGAGKPVVVTLNAGFMDERDEEGMPSGHRVTPPPGPWDDCFGGFTSPPVVEWPGLMRLVIDSSCDVYQVYTEEPHAVCVEPQTSPPNSLNTGADIVELGRPLVATASWCWELA
jgi:aldose 1-epimerase